MIKIHWINEKLNWRVEECAGVFSLFNGFGYAGRYSTLGEACRADAAMSQEPAI
jgi:hypothetical protein